MAPHQVFVENIKCSGYVNGNKNSGVKKSGATPIGIFKVKDDIPVTGVAAEREEMLTVLAFLDCLEKATKAG